MPERFTEQQIAEGVRGFVQETINTISRNLYTMRDTKGRNRYASGDTARDIGRVNPKRDWVKVSKKGGLIIKIYMPVAADGAPYWRFINEGVKGAETVQPNTGLSPFRFRNKRPPLSAIRLWMMNRRIVPRKNGKRIDQGHNAESRRNSLAWVIAESIRRKGIEAVPFFDAAVADEKILQLEKDLMNLYAGKFIEDIEFEFKD